MTATDYPMLVESGQRTMVRHTRLESRQAQNA
jgi:hypothetical protein